MFMEGLRPNEEPNPPPRRVSALVIGGGVIGLATARELALEGAEVGVIEAGRIGRGASLGNTGLVPPSHSFPLNSPGMVRKALRWAVDPDSPFYVRPRLDRELATFLIRFALHSRPGRIPMAVAAMRDLNLLSLDRLKQVLAELDPVPFRQDGVLNVYRSKAGFEGARREAGLLRDYGLESREVAPDALPEEEPALVSSSLSGGVFWPEDAAIDPAALVAALAKDLRARGTILCEGVQALELERHGSSTLVRTSSGSIEAETVVVAAGSRSSQLVRRVGRSFPLQPAKGYSVTVNSPATMLKRPLLLSEDKVAVSPMSGRLRLAGTLELAGFDLSLSRRRVAAIERAGESYLRGWTGTGCEAWAGLRALSGDGLPIIGSIRGHDSVIVATGHGHVGIGMAAGTASLVAALTAGREPPIDPRPYSPRRFRGL
jgi:D-amino-acid dehydrogenase